MNVSGVSVKEVVEMIEARIPYDRYVTSILICPLIFTVATPSGIYLYHALPFATGDSARSAAKRSSCFPNISHPNRCWYFFAHVHSQQPVRQLTNDRVAIRHDPPPGEPDPRAAEEEAYGRSQDPFQVVELIALSCRLA